MPEMTSTQRRVLALCSLVSAGDRCDWSVLARQAHRERSLDGLMAGDILESSAKAHTTGWVIKTASAESWTAAWERADSEYRAATAAGARLTTVLDDDFPLNLRLIHRAAQHLPNATLVVRDGAHHGVWVGDDCIDDIVRDFLSDPDQAPDTSCADESRPVEWYQG